MRYRLFSALLDGPFVNVEGDTPYQAANGWLRRGGYPFRISLPPGGEPAITEGQGRFYCLTTGGWTLVLEPVA